MPAHLSVSELVSNLAHSQGVGSLFRSSVWDLASPSPEPNHVLGTLVRWLSKQGHQESLRDAGSEDVRTSRVGLMSMRFRVSQRYQCTLRP